ncbi:unnamed protein product, partial [Darwinula stevensoni]
PRQIPRARIPLTPCLRPKHVNTQADKQGSTPIPSDHLQIILSPPRRQDPVSAPTRSDRHRPTQTDIPCCQDEAAPRRRRHLRRRQPVVLSGPDGLRTGQVRRGIRLFQLRRGALRSRLDERGLRDPSVSREKVGLHQQDCRGLRHPHVLQALQIHLRREPRK